MISNLPWVVSYVSLMLIDSVALFLQVKKIGFKNQSLGNWGVFRESPMVIQRNTIPYCFQKLSFGDTFPYSIFRFYP